MNVAFLFPGNGMLYEALDNWVATIARYNSRTTVSLIRNLDGVTADVVFLLTEGRSYPTERIDADIAALTRMGKPFGVVHNNDNPGVPTPRSIPYPSFCWTQQAMKRLERYSPVLVRQPVLPFCMKHKERPLHIGTFGHIERKKSTLEMARWAKMIGAPFTALCPAAFADQNQLYINGVRANGAKVVIHPWADKIEDLAPLMEDISHFLFVLPKSKGGSGGSPTSPRYATAFARPVIVVDDEPADDGIYRFDSLDVIGGLDKMTLPQTNWGPSQYISRLVHLVQDWRPS